MSNIDYFGSILNALAFFMVATKMAEGAEETITGIDLKFAILLFEIVSRICARAACAHTADSHAALSEKIVCQLNTKQTKYEQ
jgi:hypothetical protein